MRICIFAEGSYPYVLGGVSSWINTLTRACPEHEFIIYAISAESSCKGKYKYELPKNVIEIIDVFLDDIRLVEGRKGKKYKLDKEHDEALKGLLMGDNFSWNVIFKFFMDSQFKHATEFFMSKNFFNLVKQTYINQYPYTPFTEFLWTMRSIYLVLFYLLMKDLPMADLYHSVSTGYAGILASYAKFLYKRPFILSEHGIYTREREEEIIKADWVKGYHKEIWINYFYNLSRCAYSYADVVTSLFNSNKQLQIELGCNEEKISIIPNGVDVSRFDNIPREKGTDTINIGAIIRVVPIKDIKTMLQSFSIVKDEIENVKFYIMGPAEEDPEYYDECLQLVKQMELQGVTFTGTVNIAEYIGKMDILVLTSISEGQPLAVMEGMAARKPHVCTNVGDCRDLLYGRNDHYGQAGFVEHIMDHNGIAESIIKLCKDENLRNEMGQNAYNRVSKLYRKEDFIMRYKKIYEEYGSE
ncbi:GT4 family glycosyltransferase PelF [Wukongibacter sp. M2B1]|uniref:GT4 family glycosyltransferase PelF n=1 Tax=Wukongibacter sp. M2B1 TaxID=3088895 RepID=UPI003D7B5950